MRRLGWKHWAGALALGTLTGVLIPVQVLFLNAHRLPASILYGVPRFVAFAVVFLLAVAVAEARAGSEEPTPIRRYVGCGIVATLACLAVSILYSATMPGAPRERRVVDSTNTSTVYTAAERLPSAIFAAGFDGCVHGWLAMLIYARLRNAHIAARKLERAELEREEAARRLADARLEAAHARVDPAALSASLEEIERLYDHDAARAQARLDELTAFLRDAIPRVRKAGEASVAEVA